jgi:WD40 repeat protein/tRNA A-37 threonylcarbamoyl transferase component Bud32
MPECDICHTPLEVRGTRTFCPACLLRDLMADEPKELLETQITPMPQALDLPQVPRFQLIEKLGEGGFAVVYRALQREPVRREVAVKVLKAQVASGHVLARFETERQTLARMEHPGIARLWDTGRTAEGQPFFAMELVRGEPVTSYCKVHALGLRERLTLFIAVCEAVQHAHEKGVLHRDLKPSNLLAFESEGEHAVKIIDFGIAKALEVTRDDEPETGPLTSLHQTVGTPGYMSPEQSAWGASIVDARSDLYALGVVLYELLTGCTPLQIERRANDESKHWPVAKHITAPSKLASQFLLTKTQQRDVDAIVLKALESDSTRRYASAAALAEDVQRHLKDEPVLAGETSWTYVMEKFARRHRPLVISGAVALLAIIAALAVSTLMFFKEQAARAHVERTQAELRRTLSRADFSAAQRYKQDGDYQSAVACLTRALRNDPTFSAAGADLRMMLMQEDTPQPVEAAIPLLPEWGELTLGAVSGNGHELAVVMKAATKERLLLFHHMKGAWQTKEIAISAPVTTLALAPSGNALAWAEVDQGVRLQSQTNDDVPRVWTCPEPVTALSTAVQGNSVVVGGSEGGVWIMPQTAALQPRLLGRLEGSVTHLHLGVRESWVVAGSRGGEISRLSVNQAEAKELLLQMPAAVTALGFSNLGMAVVAGDAVGNVACFSGNGALSLAPTLLHSGQVTAVACSLDQGYVLSAGGGVPLAVRWYDPVKKTDLKPPLVSAGIVRSILLNRTSDEALLVNADSSVRVWRQASPGAMTLRKPQRSRYVASPSQGRSLALRREAGSALEVLELPQHITLGQTLHAGGPVHPGDGVWSALAFAEDGHSLVQMMPTPQPSSVWDTTTAARTGAAFWKQQALALQQSPGKRMLMARRNGALVRVSTEGEPLKAMLAGDAAMTWEMAAISPDGKAAAWATRAPEGQFLSPVRVLWRGDGEAQMLQAERLSCLAIHGGTRTICLGMTNGFVRLMREQEPKVVTLPLHQSQITSVAFSPDGRVFLTASTDGMAALWDAQQLTPLADFFRLGEPVLQVAFSGDGQRFACATAGQVVVGDVAARALLGQPFMVRAMGGALALNHDGTRVAFTLDTGEVMVHDIAPPQQRPVPAWFLTLADTYVSRRVNEQGAIEATEHPGLTALRALVPDEAGSDEWSRFAHWLFTHSGKRTLTPWSELTLEGYLSALQQRPGPATSFEQRRLMPYRYRERGEPPP